MATIDISFENLKKDLNKKDLTIDKLEEIFFDFGLEIDSYNLEEDILKVEITAERVDLLSYYGLLRALKAYLEIETYVYLQIKESGLEVNVDKSAIDYGNYTLCAIIKNLDLDDSKIKEIINVQEKLHLTYGRKRQSVAIGVYPLDKINFPITFLAEKPDKIKFIPLGEDKELTGKQIIENHPTGISYSKLVEGKDKYLCFVDSKNKVLSMPPIINSKETGRVVEQTKDLFIECTGKSLYKLEHVINILSCMFKDMGGDVYSLKVNYPDKKIISPCKKEDKRKLTLKDIKNLIGIDVDINLAKKLLERMMHEVKVIDDKTLEVNVLGFRTDVLHTNDLCDDVSRAYTLSKIIPTTAKVISFSEKLPESILQEDVIRTMISMGFIESMPLVLSSIKDSFENFNLKPKDHISLGFSAESSLNMVSNWYIPKLFKILVNNQHKSFPQKIFVCDYAVVSDSKSDIKSKTILKLSSVIAKPKVSFTEISSVLLGLCNVLGKKLELVKKDYEFFIPGRSAEVLIDGEKKGFIGEFSPEVLIKNNYTNPVCGFEIDL